MTAGMDLSLALIEEDLGRDVAHKVAQEMVMFLRRPGSQSQFSVPLWSAQPRTDPIRAAVSAIHADPGARHGTDNRVDTIARRCGFGTAETLRRAFHRHARIAPADYRTRFRSTREFT